MVQIEGGSQILCEYVLGVQHVCQASTGPMCLLPMTVLEPQGDNANNQGTADMKAITQFMDMEANTQFRDMELSGSFRK